MTDEGQAIEFCGLTDREEVVAAFRKCRDPLQQLLATEKAVGMEMRRLRDVEIDGVTFGAGDINGSILSARAARTFSYAPYSRFNVGAAISTRKAIVQGCNVENAAYGSTVCAERTAAFRAAAQGEREFNMVGIVGGFDSSVDENLRVSTEGTYIFPCGCCRQVLNEFGGGDLGIVLATDTDKVLVSLLKYMLPGGFGPETLSVDPKDYHRNKR
jgi:cytidine deaminase